ncbi:MAG: hypothetical protein ACOH2H_12985 [Cypionkella sp.]
MTDRTEVLTDLSAPTRSLDGHYTDWPAILAGSVIASALAFVFSTFGAAVGMATISPYQGAGSVTAYVVAGTSWLLWTSVSSFMVGGYVAGRMRRRVDRASGHEVAVRDGVHGLAVWGVGVLLSIMLASFVASGGATGGAAQTTAAVVQQLEPSASVTTGAAAGATTAPDSAQIELMKKKYAIISALAIATSLLVAAAGAYWAAGKGGEHRDEGREFTRFGTWN